MRLNDGTEVDLSQGRVESLCSSQGQGLSRDAFNKPGLLLLALHLFPQGDKGVKGERGERGDRGLRGDPVNTATASS